MPDTENNDRVDSASLHMRRGELQHAIVLVLESLRDGQPSQSDTLSLSPGSVWLHPSRPLPASRPLLHPTFQIEKMA